MPTSRPTFRRDDPPLARAASSNNRLWSLIEDTIAGPLAAYETAREVASSARDLTVETPDVRESIREDVSAGSAVDVTDALARISAQDAARRDTETARSFLVGLQDEYRASLGRAITATAPILWAGLAGQLDDVLDRSAEALADLGGPLDADAALTSGRTEEYRHALALQDEYASVREAHLALLRASSGGYGPDSLLRPFAFFATPLAVAPQLIRVLRSGIYGSGHEEGWRVADALPMPFADHESRVHFVFVVEHRTELSPHIGSHEDADLALRVASAAERSGSIEMPRGDLGTFHGSDRGVYQSAGMHIPKPLVTLIPAPPEPDED